MILQTRAPLPRLGELNERGFPRPRLPQLSSGERYALLLALFDAPNASCACFGLPLLDQFDVGLALLK